MDEPFLWILGALSIAGLAYSLFLFGLLLCSLFERSARQRKERLAALDAEYDRLWEEYTALLSNGRSRQDVPTPQQKPQDTNLVQHPCG